MSVHSTRRFVLLLLIVVPLLYLRCQQPPPATTTDTTTTTAPKEHRCPPNERRYKPEIKVDVTKLTADPKVAVIWDNEPVQDLANDPPYKSSGNKVKITWKASDPNFPLLVEWKGTCDVIEKPDCKTTKGECTARVSKDVTENVPCMYEMKKATNLQLKDESAEIIVMPCCQ